MGATPRTNRSAKGGARSSPHYGGEGVLIVSDIAAAHCAARGKLGHLSSLRKDDSVMAVALDSEDTPTTNRTSIGNRRIEVITGRERRRRWTAEQKREI